jgi:predicted amidohydrolase YtcJ
MNDGRDAAPAGAPEPEATLVIEDVEVEGRAGQRVGVSADTVVFVEDMLSSEHGATNDATVIDGAGGALLPGLHDHHLHLMAMAAREDSVPCGPPEVADREDLGHRLRAAAAAAAPDRWVRGVGFDDTTAGPLDAHALDEMLGRYREVPVRIQHRSGHQWVLNGAGVALVEQSARSIPVDGPGAGVYFDDDERLGRRWRHEEEPAIEAVGRGLVALGITGVTDATVSNGPTEVARFEHAQRTGVLPQRVHVLGAELPSCEGVWLSTGARKIVLAEHALPGLEELVAAVAGAGGRGVAIHCVSREALVLAAVALREAGPLVTAARLEHAAVAPPEVVELLDGLEVTVVTQPGFVQTNGDRYRRDVDHVDLPWLYRLRGWIEAGIDLAGSSDAPFGDPDPWSGMRAATERRTATGSPLGPTEALTPEQALDLYLTPLDDPGGSPRRIRPGAVADLCLLSAPWRVVRQEFDADCVRATFVDGTIRAGG